MGQRSHTLVPHSVGTIANGAISMYIHDASYNPIEFPCSPCIAILCCHLIVSMQQRCLSSAPSMRQLFGQPSCSACCACIIAAASPRNCLLATARAHQMKLSHSRKLQPA